MSVIALIPARSGSKGIPGKNLRELGGKTLIEHAFNCGWDAGCDIVCLTTDIARVWPFWFGLDQVDTQATRERRYLLRPPELAQDDTPMIDVVKHALSCIPGSSEDIWVLLQPTQPFRTPAHVHMAIALLQESGADSVVSVVELPRTHHPDFTCHIIGPRLYPQPAVEHMSVEASDFAIHEAEWWDRIPARRQDANPAFIRDGTVYAFRRATVETYGNIYGEHVRPLLMAPEDTCELDTEQDWAEVERRWKERHG